jgi:hypothetical protein
VKHSFCNQTVRTCQCLQGHRPNDENTACSTDNGSEGALVKNLSIAFYALLSALVVMRIIPGTF